MPSSTFSVSVIGRGTTARGRNRKGKDGKRQQPRDKPQSAVACAAYRSGETLTDERLQQTFDYTRKEDILHTEIMTPEGAPAWAKNRATLWNHVEAFETRKDARLARSIIAGLPRELSREQNLALVRRFAQRHLTAKGMIADIAIHESDASDGGKNPHCHIMVSVRPLDGDEFATAKGEQWSNQTLIVEWRAAWEKLTNDALESAGREERVSLKSNEERGIDKTPGVHLGEKAWNMEQRGIATEKGRKNRRAKHDNALNRPRKRKEKPREIDAPEEKAPQNLREVANDQQVPPDENNRSQPKDEQGTADPPPPAWLRHQKMLKSYRYKSRLGVEVTLAGVRARVEKVREETEHENTILTRFDQAGELGRQMKDKDKDHER